MAHEPSVLREQRLSSCLQALCIDPTQTGDYKNTSNIRKRIGLARGVAGKPGPDLKKRKKQQVHTKGAEGIHGLLWFVCLCGALRKVKRFELFRSFRLILRHRLLEERPCQKEAAALERRNLHCLKTRWLGPTVSVYPIGGTGRSGARIAPTHGILLIEQRQGLLR
jgi:hypothetical protein